ncbi:hypothetical protein HOY82DRAFT_646741 [Tuber indicum]|nr:hypothetical protein HOY82DRAFT_646741 [Tuber indicum]
MAQGDVVAYNIAAFLATLFLLEFGADKFIHHTAVVVRRTGISETIIGLLTAGGEWEELAVVVASLARGRSSLVLRNIIGAAVSNILSAFSVDLLFYEKGKPIKFDRSSRIYSILLHVLTTFVTRITYFSWETIWGYVIFVGFAISRGVLTTPEAADGDSSNDDSSNGRSTADVIEQNNAVPELPAALTPATAPPPRAPRRQHNLGYHLFYLFLGFLAIRLAGNVLLQAPTNITDQFGIADGLFGVIILGIATTLPEKFVAVMSAGSNIFLVALCAGIIMVDTKGTLDGANVTIPELVVLWAVWFEGEFCPWIGAVMLACYISFIVCEFTVMHRVGD